MNITKVFILNAINKNRGCTLLFTLYLLNYF